MVKIPPKPLAMAAWHSIARRLKSLALARFIWNCAFRFPYIPDPDVPV
jgi:hypothetical protein